MKCNCLPTAAIFTSGIAAEDDLHAVVLRHLEDQGVSPEVVLRLRRELEATHVPVADAHAGKLNSSRQSKGELVRLFGYATQGPFLRVASCVLAGWVVCLIIEALATGLRVEAAALGGAISVAAASVLVAAWIATRRGHSAVTRLYCAWVIFYSVMLAGCLARAALWEHMTASMLSLVIVLLLLLAVLSQPQRLWATRLTVPALNGDFTKSSPDNSNGLATCCEPESSGSLSIFPVDVAESPARGKVPSPTPPTTTRHSGNRPTPPRRPPSAGSPRPAPPGQPQTLVKQIIGALDMDPWDISMKGTNEDRDVLATSRVASLLSNKRSLSSPSPTPPRRFSENSRQEEKGTVSGNGETNRETDLSVEDVGEDEDYRSVLSMAGVVSTNEIMDSGDGRREVFGCIAGEHDQHSEHNEHHHKEDNDHEGEEEDHRSGGASSDEEVALPSPKARGSIERMTLNGKKLMDVSAVTQEDDVASDDSTAVPNARGSTERMSIALNGGLMDISAPSQTATDGRNMKQPPRAPPAPPVSRGVSFTLEDNDEILAALQRGRDSRITSRRSTTMVTQGDLPTDFNSGQRVSFSRENKMIDLPPQYYSDEEEEEEDNDAKSQFARVAPRFSVVCTTQVGSAQSSPDSSSSDEADDEDLDDCQRNVSMLADDFDSDEDEAHVADDGARALNKAQRQSARAAARALAKIADRKKGECSSSSSSSSSNSSDESQVPAKQAKPRSGRRATSIGPGGMNPLKGGKKIEDESEDEDEDEEEEHVEQEDKASDHAKANKVKPPDMSGSKKREDESGERKKEDDRKRRRKEKREAKREKKRKEKAEADLLTGEQVMRAFENNLHKKQFVSSALGKERTQELREVLGMRSQYTLHAEELLAKLSLLTRNDSDAGLSGMTMDQNMFSGGTSQDDFNRMREAVAGQLVLEELMSSSRKNSALLEIPGADSLRRRSTLLEVPGAAALNPAPEVSTDASQIGAMAALGWNPRRASEPDNHQRQNASFWNRSRSQGTLGLPVQAGSRRASNNVGVGGLSCLSPLPEQDESCMSSAPTSPRRSIGPTEMTGEASQPSEDQFECMPCETNDFGLRKGVMSANEGFNSARRPSSPHRSSEAATAPGLLTKVLCAHPGITLGDLVQSDPMFAMMTLQELVRRAGEEGLALVPEPAKPIADSIVRRDSLNDLGINLDSAFVQQMLTMLNGGQAPQKCNCKPGMPHSCMSPAASAFASLAATVSHTVSATVQATAQASRRTSNEDLRDKSRASGDRRDHDSDEDDSSDSSNSSDSEGSATGFGPCDSVGSTSSFKDLRKSKPAALKILAEASPSGGLSPKTLSNKGSPAAASPSGGLSPSNKEPVSPKSPGSVSGKARGSNIAEAGSLLTLRTEEPMSPHGTGDSVKRRSDGSSEAAPAPLPAAKRKLSRDDDTDIGAGRLNLGSLEPSTQDESEGYKQSEVQDTDELAVSVEDNEIHQSSINSATKSACRTPQGSGTRSGVRTRNQSLLSVFDAAPGKQTSHTELAQPEDLSELDGEVFTRIPPDELAVKLATGSVQVIDVRGRDFKGGHIPDCAHVRTSSILENPASVLEICSNRPVEVKDIVFTCMYSKLRAPRCASAVARHLQRSPENYPASFVVSILQGGMHGWVNHWHKKNTREEFSKQVEDFDSTIWQDCADVGRSEGQLFTYGLVHSMDAVWSEGGQKELALALEDALRDRLRRLSHDLNDPDAQDVLAIQKVDPSLMSPKMTVGRSTSSENQDAVVTQVLRHKEALERRSLKRSGSGASVSSNRSTRGSAVVRTISDESAKGEDGSLRRKSMGANSRRFSVVSVPEDNVLDQDLDSETECSDSSDDSYSASD